MSESPQTPEAFVQHFVEVTQRISGQVIGSDLEEQLNQAFPAGGEWFEAAKRMCRAGCEEGWLCAREAGGIKFGRAVPPSDTLNGMSIDVGEMDSIVGPHHSHPNGEIDLVMPLLGAAEFDGRGAGWKVYGPGSAHRPTVTGGKALVLYLLPDGAIEFTRG